MNLQRAITAPVMGALRCEAALQPQIGEKSHYQGEISDLEDSVPLDDLVPSVVSFLMVILHHMNIPIS